jgi:hypothetical protein
MLYQANDPISEGFIKNIQLLLEHGADAGLSVFVTLRCFFFFLKVKGVNTLNVFQDITSGKTPVHIAVEKRDPFLLELLLSKCPGSANAPMYNDNRPLHSAATLSEVTDIQQLELVNILLKYGADKALRNKANKLPIELVQQDRDRVGYQFVCRFPWNKCALFLNFSIAGFFGLIIKTVSHWLFV